MPRMSATSVHQARDLGVGQPADAQPELEVLAHRHVRIERVALEHHGDVAVLGRDVVHDPPVDADGAGGDLLEPGDQAEDGGLAAAGRTDQHQELVILDVQIEVVDHADRSEVLGDALEKDVRHDQLTRVDQDACPMRACRQPRNARNTGPLVRPRVHALRISAHTPRSQPSPHVTGGAPIAGAGSRRTCGIDVARTRDEIRTATSTTPRRPVRTCSTCPRPDRRKLAPTARQFLRERRHSRG